MKTKLAAGLRELFSVDQEVSTEDIYAWFARTEPQIPRTTVNWRVYEMVHSGLLIRVGRGRFRPAALGKPVWAPPRGTDKIAEILTKEFPLAASCQWSTGVLTEFQQHLAATPFTVVEVERDALSGVYYRIKEFAPDTFLEPTRTLVEEHVLGRHDAVVVKTLVSEAPLSGPQGDRRPTLEKLLVDLVADQDLFFFLQGVELWNVYQNAGAKYLIHIDRLLRYAARRGRKNDVARLMTVEAPHDLS